MSGRAILRPDVLILGNSRMIGAEHERSFGMIVSSVGRALKFDGIAVSAHFSSIRRALGVTNGGRGTAE